jgi:hypothetical protein
MSDPTSSEIPFATVTMAEILLGQDMIAEAAEVIDRLVDERGDDARVVELLERIRERSAQGEVSQDSIARKMVDHIEIESRDGVLRISFELTDQGLAMARRKVRYSGHSIVRLFTASTGPRGVRKNTRDIEILHPAAQFDIHGLPRSSVHVAAIGFLGRNGAFVPLARSGIKGMMS